MSRHDKGQGRASNVEASNVEAGQGQGRARLGVSPAQGVFSGNVVIVLDSQNVL